MYDNHDDVVQQMQAHGLVVETLQTGKLYRCKTAEDRGRQKSGWYSLHELRTEKGAVLLVGAFGNWREGVDPSTGRALAHRVELKGRRISPEERGAIRQRIAEEKRKADAARAREAERAARRAKQVWQRLAESGSSSYLVRKGVHGFGVRFSAKGNLVIPIQDGHGQLHGLQVIYGDEKTRQRKGRDKDYWPAGMDKRGKYHLIGGTPREVVLVVEGYATGATLHEATGLPVAVAFDAGNITSVCKALRKRYRETRPLVCADDDYLIKCLQCQTVFPVADGTCPECGKAAHHGNAGITAASSAALAVNGAWMVPRFSARTTEKWTDFNDLHQQEGLHVVRHQVEAKIEELGWLAPAPPRRNGEMGADEWFFSIEVLLEEFALIYGTETVFDGVRRRIVGLGALRAAAGKSQVRMWLEHPERRTVLPEDVVFDPAGRMDDPRVCNLWGGWPTSPKPGSCELLLELLEFLCSNEDNPREVYDWILNWIAYPIQNPGAKMQTALLMHGPEGTGKNTFFSCVRNIYAQYGGIFDQTQLESQFNGWASGKLFMIGNEVVTRVELYHQQGRLKNMITETEWQINEKNLPTRLEQNHCNFVFFSNRIDIAKLDKEDRRYCVVWTPPAAPAMFYDEVSQEIEAGGVAALHDMLLNRDLAEFNAHTKPPSTRAKRELIELSMDSTERFWRDWTEGHLPVPCTAVRSEDLYSVYRYWAHAQGIPRAAPQNILLGMVGKKIGVQRKRSFYYLHSQTRKQSTFIFPRGVLTHMPEDKSETAWLSEEVPRVQGALESWKEEP